MMYSRTRGAFAVPLVHSYVIRGFPAEYPLWHLRYACRNAVHTGGLTQAKCCCPAPSRCPAVQLVACFAAGERLAPESPMDQRGRRVRPTFVYGCRQCGWLGQRTAVSGVKKCCPRCSHGTPDQLGPASLGRHIRRSWRIWLAARGSA